MVLGGGSKLEYLDKILMENMKLSFFYEDKKVLYYKDTSKHIVTVLE